MIWAVEADEKRLPLARVHAPDGTVELIQGYNSATHLVVVTGAAGHPVSLAQLLSPVRNRADYCLALGVLGAGVSEQDLEALVENLDAVFHVPDGEIATVARRLALAVTTPGEPSHPWCCDWNDMRSLVSGVRSGVGRTASARAVGPSAAKEAAIVALERLGSVENCRVLSLLTGPQSLRGAQIKEVSAEIGSRVGEGDYMAGVHQDSSIPEDTVQVDIFVFGPAELHPGAPVAAVAVPPAVEIPEIPAFLRKGCQP